ncbi:MAG TPA: hypothetical protein VLJ39_02085, partial [Tepidisphaeraceae bacterium]|nr:hypothetical protein [Tepidisphaeraceae bacterium]
MTRVGVQPVGGARRASPAQITQYTGEVVYLYAFDIAYELIRKPVATLLGQPVAQFVVDASKRSPRQLFFYRPQMVRLPPMERLGPQGPVRVERSIKLLPIGAISIMVRVPFKVNDIEELVPFHDLQFSNSNWLYDEVRALAADVQRELQPYLVRPNPLQRRQPDHLRPVKEQVPRTAFARVHHELRHRLAEQLPHRLALHVVG